MRTKSDATRKRVMVTAREVFREFGFEKSTMAEIATRLGGSKATLYRYFPNKEELFAATIVETEQQNVPQMLALLDPTDSNVAGVLHRAGLAYARHITSKGVIAVTRMALSPGTDPKVSRAVYDRGPNLANEAFSEFLDAVVSAGFIPPTDTHIAALHLRALLEAGCFEAVLFGVEPRLSLEQSAKAAVEAFMRLYG
ncbi:TetR/AcrR family transcriptional regulator [Caulobacter sp. BK020]|uniref:TetR/AcrR family transcriptional regulator n=1 Tax=Caulobacter sp. BK020 TaxID=2512117 RepID=UPI0010EE8411|nr:TetR/AcrR family transcriptional regulator [Caulobacter sp. BK020]TCS17335.1 TetR family transcriptional regulator [Caulobacter sp. BK020]